MGGAPTGRLADDAADGSDGEADELSDGVGDGWIEELGASFASRRDMTNAIAAQMEATVPKNPMTLTRVRYDRDR